jgi:Cft2 family RNA processing exonuclease
MQDFALPQTAAEVLSPILEVRPGGLYAPAFAASIDPPVPVSRAILSHAHSDHAVAGHGEVWATPETLALYRRRHPDWNGAAAAFSYGEGPEQAGVRLRLVPSGHILGSAQLHFEGSGTSILYTGDFKRRPSRTARSAEAPRATVLLTESTFGLPVFRFPPQETLESRLIEACREAISRSETPVLLAYALGKTQEAAAILAEAGIPTVLHGAAWKLVPEYQAAGVPLPLSRPYESGPPEPGEALIAPPNCARTGMVRNIRRRRVLYLSGWALRAASRAEFDADVLLPFSDHADFDELLRHIEEVAAETIVATHGFARDFARILSARGLRALPLLEPSERPADDA